MREIKSVWSGLMVSKIGLYGTMWKIKYVYVTFCIFLSELSLLSSLQWRIGTVRALCKKMIGACYCHKANRGHCIRKYSLIYLHRVRTHRALGSEHGVVDVEGAGAGAGQSCTSHLFDRQCLLFWLLTLFVFLSRKLSPRGLESSSAARWSDRLM